jgi:histidinol-phosphatase (PHP family)
LTPPPDYHVHTRFSCDSQVDMAAACEAAIARGMREIAFTDHADFEPLDVCAGYFRPTAYLTEVERCRRRYGRHLTIRTGVEVGEAHVYCDQIAALLEAHAFDFVLGAVHWVNGRLVHDEHFFASHTLDEGLQAYFEELARLASEAEYDVLAHFDIVRRAVHCSVGLKTLDYGSYEGIIRYILRTLVERGKGLEINTSPLRCGMGDPNPALQVLRWYRELGGEVLTFGSDAHTAEAIGASFDIALAMTQAAGFTHLATFEHRQVHLTSM